MDISISDAAPQDYAELEKLYLQVRQQTFFWLDKDALQQASFIADTKGELILKAQVQGEIVGFISVWQPDNFIHHLYIKSDFQRNGVGRALLQKAISILDGPVTLKCLQQNTSAVNFYLKNNWLKKSEGFSYEGMYILFEYKGR
ncbi:GNAT family N-acetyltransferase [Chondrinema litorale]|uniref:GNAT family N-acetyltransferase n=1 Tax=Chondrinema litorale TaxID=2994555 RepID=UPI0025431E61|nr:GNAT family N-acetyltransferase [Chondrinema litorale]UZR95225.1 GNAT family N-acetyltransferase [Chondrinema litorale]